MEVKVKFWCNAGYTEEIVIIEVSNEENKDKEIDYEFVKWLDNNEDCGFDIIN